MTSRHTARWPFGQWDFFQEHHALLSAMGTKVNHKGMSAKLCQRQKTLEIQVFILHLQTQLQPAAYIPRHLHPSPALTWTPWWSLGIFNYCGSRRAKANFNIIHSKTEIKINVSNFMQRITDLLISQKSLTSKASSFLLAATLFQASLYCTPCCGFHRQKTITCLSNILVVPK